MSVLYKLVSGTKIIDTKESRHKGTRTTRLKVSYKNESYFIKVTQELSTFDVGHYRGYIESVPTPVQELPDLIQDSKIIATFQSSGPPLTITNIIEEFTRIMRR
jgi:hypothetical protein